MTMHATNTVLFDLDGTLLDTAPDLATALNRLLAEHALPAQPPENFRTAAGTGAPAMLKAGFGIEKTDPRFPVLRERLLALYEETIFAKTLCFTGMERVLDALDFQQIPWGIVTNRPYHYTRLLTDSLGLTNRARCIIAGDTLPFQKPHPAPLIHAASLMQTDPATCIYVGDMKTDVEASLDAGMLPLVALYGYADPAEKPHTWKAAGFLKKPLDLLDWLGNRSGNESGRK